MSENRIVEMLSRIDRALLAEIEILRDGRFQELRQVQSETAAAMKALDMIQPELRLPTAGASGLEAAVGRVNRRAEQARGLLAAALHGARDARARLEGLVRSEGEVGTYDRRGGRVMMSGAASPYNKTL